MFLAIQELKSGVLIIRKSKFYVAEFISIYFTNFFKVVPLTKITKNLHLTLHKY